MAKQDVELKFSLIDGVSRGLAQIQQGVSGLGASLVKVNAAAELTGKAFGALGSIAGAFGDAVSGAASVEDALRRVSIITRATTEEQTALQQAVSDAVATTRFTAEEAAGALVLMAEDGFTASQAVQQLGTVLQFAQANAQSAAVAAQGLGAVLDTFGAPATQLGALADSLTAVGVAAGAPVKVLQEGLAGVGVAADQAGLSINDTVAALGALARNGIEGGAAAKSLGKILTDAENPASKLGKALEAAGLGGKSFNEIVAALSADASKATPILAALGNKPAAALRVLLADGGGALAQFNEIINQSAGASAAAADSLNTTFLGALTRLQNQLVEARNEFLTPLLAPLAAEFEKFSAKITAFTSSEQFKILSQQFAEFVTNGIGALGDKLAQIDFNDVASKISNFATGSGDTVQKLKTIIDGTAAAIVAVGDAAKLTSDILNGEFFSGEANWNRYNAAVARGKKGIEDHARSLQDARDAAKKFGAQVTIAGDAAGAVGAKAAAATPGLDAFGNSLDKLGKDTKGGADSFNTLKVSAEQAAIGLERLRLATLSDAIATLARANLQGTDTFRALVAEVGKTEANIRQMQDAIDGAAKSQKDLADKTNQASDALRNQSSAADSASQSGANLSSSNSQVAESFGNIGQQSSEAAISLGTMTQAYLEQIIAVAGNAKSAGDYIRAISAGFAAFEDEEKRIRDRIAILDRQNASLSEEDKIRAQIERRYGTSSTLVDVLIQKELALHEARKKTNEETQRGLDLEKERAGVAGALGTGRANADQGAATAAGKGAGDQGGGKGTTVVNNISVSAVLPTERSAVRSWVADVLVPELQNYQRLGR